MKRFVLHATVGAWCVASGLASSAGGQVPEGFEVVTLANDLGIHSPTDLNDRSEVVWSSSFPPDVSTMFMFSDGIIRKVIDEDWYDISPVINAEGMIAWMRGPDWNVPFDVMIYENGASGEIPGALPTVERASTNDFGHVVWSHHFSENASRMELFFYDGITIQQITNNGRSNQSARLSNLEEIVWTSKDLDVSPWTSKIMLYSHSKILELTDGTGAPGSPDINDLSVVVWRHRGEEGSEMVKRWENGTTQIVIENGSTPRINNKGDIAFTRWNDGDEQRDVWLYKDGDFYSLPDAGFGAFRPRINDRGEVTWNIWQNDFGDTGVFFMRRVGPKGDADHDCHIDFSDFQSFQICYTGPNQGPPGGLLGPCQRADFDNDNDVDRGDYEAFLEAFTGPGQTVPDCEL